MSEYPSQNPLKDTKMMVLIAVLVVVLIYLIGDCRKTE